ncbi:MAG TPA: hypothetical protein PKD41_08025, partial [Solidesulfovibrio sp.]|nr:hypothetical protein [Desulfovibrio sp.]HML60825.1 hypothetical protein [Solidesulfovibrio sp.]
GTPPAADRAPAGTACAAEIMDALRELAPHLEARKPRPCAKILAALREMPCDDALRDKLASLDALVRGYKFPQALELVRGMLPAAPGEVP